MFIYNLLGFLFEGILWLGLIIVHLIAYLNLLIDYLRIRVALLPTYYPSPRKGKGSHSVFCPRRQRKNAIFVDVRSFLEPCAHCYEGKEPKDKNTPKKCFTLLKFFWCT